MDTCHFDFYGKKNFKEISLSVYLFREYLYKNVLPKSYRIITESNELKKKIIKLYKLKANSIISIPNLPSILLKNKKLSNKKKNVKKKYNISKEFYFYPAQFWEHKNHEIILKSIKQFKYKKRDINFIFCGKDKGNLKYIINKITEYKIKKNVRILGYINDGELLELYKTCKALVMPSYFGPTNMPPLEAFALGVPVVVSDLPGLRDQVGDAGLLVSPDNFQDLGAIILRLLEDPKLKDELSTRGTLRLKEFSNQKRISKLFEIFNTYKIKRQTWTLE